MNWLWCCGRWKFSPTNPKHLSPIALNSKHARYETSDWKKGQAAGGWVLFWTESCNSVLLDRALYLPLTLGFHVYAFYWIKIVLDGEARHSIGILLTPVWVDALVSGKVLSFCKPPLDATNRSSNRSMLEGRVGLRRKNSVLPLAPVDWRNVTGLLPW